MVSGTFPRTPPSNPDMSTLSLMQGTVGLLILRSLQKGPAHGYAITRWVHERTDGVLAVEDAALYQALHRLEAKGWVEAEWGVSENNRRAKYYGLTAEGRKPAALRDLVLAQVRRGDAESCWRDRTT